MKSLLKLTWVELKLFFREPLTLVFSFALPVVFLLVMGGVFSELVHRMVGAYEARANQLYGKPKAASFQPVKPLEQKS